VKVTPNTALKNEVDVSPGSADFQIRIGKTTNKQKPVNTYRAPLTLVNKTGG